MKQHFKNLVTICAFLTVVANDAHAEKTLSIAPVVGANSFNFSGSGMESRSGVLAGADVLIATSIQGLSFETGLNYLETGAKTEMFFASTETSLGYLAIPVLANWQFYKTSGGTEWFLKGGAFLTQLLSAKQKTMFFGNTEETDIKEHMSNNDILLTAGIGGRWTVMSDVLVAVDFNYAKGTMNTAKDIDGKSEGWILGTSLIIPL